jgi:excisionase family DNA binding protein
MLDNSFIHNSLTIEQVANELNCSGQTVRRLIFAGKLKSFLFGNRRLVRPQDLNEYLQSIKDGLK